MGLCHVTVPRDVQADVRLWQPEVRARGLTGVNLPGVASMAIVHPCRHGIPWQELQVPLEMGPPFGVVSDRVTVAPEWPCYYPFAYTPLCWCTTPYYYPCF